MPIAAAHAAVDSVQPMECASPVISLDALSVILPMFAQHVHQAILPITAPFVSVATCNNALPAAPTTSAPSVVTTLPLVLLVLVSPAISLTALSAQPTIFATIAYQDSLFPLIKNPASNAILLTVLVALAIMYVATVLLDIH